ncbi:hypothetical protein JNW88_27470 [Micromonospora sp. ATA32]|nr:hypothetical protein [Micromonospora sp. ATA32]
MPTTFGQWLIVVLALLLGFAVWWVLRGRQDRPAAGAEGSTVEVRPPGRQWWPARRLSGNG